MASSEGLEVSLYARVEDVDADAGSVQIDWVPVNDRTLNSFLGDSLRALRERWKATFRVEGVDAEVVDLASMRAGIFSMRTREPQKWIEAMNNASWVQLPMNESHLVAETPEEVFVDTFDIVPPQLAGKLSAILDMDFWPRVPARELRERINEVPAIQGVVIHDVGQGSANALFDSSGRAVVYFDTGMGSHRNAMTAPPLLELCSCAAPLVVLSHWDTDHWKAAETGRSELTKSTWVVPSQRIGPTHAKFATEILSNNGSILVVKRSSKPRREIALGHHMSIKYGKGRKTDRNNSGLVLEVHLKTMNGGKRSLLLLPGDARYSMCEDLPSQVDLLVASHHGADLKGNAAVPKPSNSPHRRLVYSFGPDNSYHHPRRSALSDHRAVGWNHIHWDNSAGYQGPPFGKTRATYASTDDKRQSIVFPNSALSMAAHFTSAHQETLSS